MSKKLTVAKKKDIFLALVQMQDSKKVTVAEAEDRICEEFEISEEELDSIIEEGTDNEWLDELVSA